MPRLKINATRHDFINLVSLTTIQVSNAVSPLIIYPFLLAVVGPHGYANVALAEALSLFLLTVVLYSFEIDGVAAVVGVIVEQDNALISRAYSEVVIVRTGFYVAGLALLELITFFTNRELIFLVLEWSLVSLAYAIQPNWLYQGLERNLPLAITTLCSRAGAVVAVILTVRGPADFIWALLAIGIAYLAGGLAAASFALWRFQLRLILPTHATVWRHIVAGKEIFLGNLGVSLYRDINVLLLGAFGIPSTGIAAYSLAEKLVKVIQASIRPLNQFFFPRALAVSKAAQMPSRLVFRRILALTLPQLAIIALVVACLSTGYLVYGSSLSAVKRIENSSYVFHLTAFMSIATFFGLANFMFGSAGLNALGARRYLFVRILVTGVVSVIGNLALIPAFGANGSAVCFVFAEMFLFLLIWRRYYA